MFDDFLFQEGQILLAHVERWKEFWGSVYADFRCSRHRNAYHVKPAQAAAPAANRIRLYRF